MREDQAPIASRVNFEIAPLNQSSGTNSGFSYRNGNPVISLRLPAANNMYLLTRTLRLNYVLTLVQPNGDAPTNSLVGAATAGQVLISDRIGSNSVIDSITISTASNNTIEQCRNYGRLLASSIPAGSGWNEYSTHLSHWFGGVCSSNKDVAAKVANRPIQCSSPLLTGVLRDSSAIPLGNVNGCGGMIINIQLNSNNQALFSSMDGMAGAYYKVTGVTLTGKYGIAIGGILPPIKNIMFKAYQSYYDVINTNDHTGSIDSRLDAVTSVFSNFIGTTSIQNFSQDGFATPGLNNVEAGLYANNAAVKTVNFMRSGIKFPLLFQIDETSLRQTTTAGAGVNGARLVSFDAMRQYYYQDAVRVIRDDIDALGGARSEGLMGYFATVANDSPAQITAPNQEITFTSSPSLGRCFGIGVRYDQSAMGMTASFKQSPYSFRITSALDGVSPTSIYTFFSYTATMTLYGNGQVDISS